MSSCKSANGGVDGMVVLASEPRELTIVQIDGPIKREDLASISGHVGLPHWRIRCQR